ncbi:hypothetical protein H1C71_002494 [Ictidomys tridecemlineatus]|nr:hypothetical protein H1C71_002494 [Ictidomys tridecemlineatus]
MSIPCRSEALQKDAPLLGFLQEEVNSQWRGRFVFPATKIDRYTNGATPCLPLATNCRMESPQVFLFVCGVLRQTHLLQSKPTADLYVAGLWFHRVGSKEELPLF